jgi:Concanavalin A-like lectin/glucanases superfamily
MKHCRTLLSSLALVLAPSMLSAQAVCPAGVQPDGFINWSHLPAAPLITTGTTTPVTVTIPVDGPADLIATVQIPALTGTSSTPIPAYTVNGDRLQFNAYGAGLQTIVHITFNSAIRGASVNASIAGTVNSASMTAYTQSFAAPQSEITMSAGGNLPGQFSPLQVRAVVAPQITSLDLTFSAVLASPPPAILSNLRIESEQASIPDPLNQVPRIGLMQWLPSEDAQPSHWPDISNNGHDATQTIAASQPQLTFDGAHCRSSLAFHNNQFMNFTLPISGWSHMTIFLVAKSDDDVLPGQATSNSAAILWNENQYWGNTYIGPFWTHDTFRFGTTQVGNYPNYQRPTTIGGDFTLTTAVHNGGTDTLYINGTQALQQMGKLSVLGGMDGTAFLGRGYGNTYFDGAISEVLVYNRVLTAAEMQAVTSYLEAKFGLLPGAP